MARRSYPRLYTQFGRIRRAMGTADETAVIPAVYRRMDTVNFSRNLPERHPDRTLVIPMRGVSWSDWGSERRILDTLGADRPASGRRDPGYGGDAISHPDRLPVTLIGQWGSICRVVTADLTAGVYSSYHAYLYQHAGVP